MYNSPRISRISVTRGFFPTFTPYPLVTSTHQIIPDFTSVPFVNALGSTALTLFSMLDAFSILGIIVVILLAMKVIWWLYGFITDKPVEESVIDVTGAVEIVTSSRSGRNPYK